MHWAALRHCKHLGGLKCNGGAFHNSKMHRGQYITEMYGGGITSLKCVPYLLDSIIVFRGRGGAGEGGGGEGRGGEAERGRGGEGEGRKVAAAQLEVPSLCV